MLKITKKPTAVLITWTVLLGCGSPQTDQSEKTKPGYSTFQEEVDFIRQFTEVQVLQDPSGQGRIAVVPGLQARVMTSASKGPGGRSYGWINRGLFESGDTLDHINPFGGEERLWLGPEGGQFSIFFPRGSEFNLSSWQTPRPIDLEPFELVDAGPQRATYQKNATLVNYSGFQFDLGIEREVGVLSVIDIFRLLELKKDYQVNVIGYQTVNVITNQGEEPWKKETGLLSIWLLGMFNPSEVTTVVIPFEEGDAALLGPVVNDSYFGKVPPDRLKEGPGVLFFKGDGKYRGKIGLSPLRAKDVIGSYDSKNGILTIVKYNKPEGVSDYVNSLWELQEKPYAGDVLNSYNDGPPEPGQDPLGPFYELETSSPALALAPGESASHVQQTYHFEGKRSELDQLAQKLLGASIDQIESAFK